jgi:hypothetical protein
MELTRDSPRCRGAITKTVSGRPALDFGAPGEATGGIGQDEDLTHSFGGLV